MVRNCFVDFSLLPEGDRPVVCERLSERPRARSTSHNSGLHKWALIFEASRTRKFPGIRKGLSCGWGIPCKEKQANPQNNRKDRENSSVDEHISETRNPPKALQLATSYNVWLAGTPIPQKEANCHKGGRGLGGMRRKTIKTTKTVNTCFSRVVVCCHLMIPSKPSKLPKQSNTPLLKGTPPLPRIPKEGSSTNLLHKDGRGRDMQEEQHAGSRRYQHCRYFAMPLLYNLPSGVTPANQKVQCESCLFS